MSVLIVLIFFKSVCLYIQSIVLNCYNRYLNPRRKYFAVSKPSGNRSCGIRSILSTSALDNTPQSERDFLIEQIRMRKRAAKRRTN